MASPFFIAAYGFAKSKSHILNSSYLLKDFYK